MWDASASGAPAAVTRECAFSELEENVLFCTRSGVDLRPRQKRRAPLEDRAVSVGTRSGAMEHAVPVHYEHHDYQTVETSEVPPHGWSDGIFNCLSDGEVALWGACPLGCVQYLFAVRTRSNRLVRRASRAPSRRLRHRAHEPTPPP